jgi:hypothetical protein
MTSFTGCYQDILYTEAPMNVYKSLREIEDHLPNGFHDALLEAVAVNFSSNSARMDLRLLVGDPDAPTEEEREAYKEAALYLNDLVYFVVDAPAPGHGCSKTGGVRIDGGVASDNSAGMPKPRKPLPLDAFAYWFFVDEWNSFIHVAARSATLEWL